MGRGAERRPGRPTPAGRRSSRRATTSRGRSTPRSARVAARPTAACSSTSATCRPSTSGASCPRCTSSSRSSPTSTSRPGPMEVGPTTHYIMGGIRVDAETGATTGAGLFAAGEVAGGMHGANRLGGNSLSDLLVFGQRTGAAAAAGCRRAERRAVPGSGRRSRGRGARAGGAVRARTAGEDPYPLHEELQATMQRSSGSSGPRRTSRRRSASSPSSARAGRRSRVSGGRAFNPGWNLVFELRQHARSCPRRSPAAPAARRRAAAPTAASTSRRPTKAWGDEEHRRPPRRDGAMEVDDDAAAGRCRTSCALLMAEGEGGDLMPDAHLRVFRGTPTRDRGTSPSSTCRSRRGWSSSTPSTGSRPTRRPTSRSAGTARPPSAARAAPRSTAGRA